MIHIIQSVGGNFVISCHMIHNMKEHLLKPYRRNMTDFDSPKIFLKNILSKSRHFRFPQFKHRCCHVDCKFPIWMSKHFEKFPTILSLSNSVLSGFTSTSLLMNQKSRAEKILDLIFRPINIFCYL